jgi:hypothetical protein
MRTHIIRIFISYDVTDAAEALKFRKLLSKSPTIRVFMRDLLSAGENWEARLKKEISECDVFLFFLTQNSLGSSWVLQELGAAWAIEKPIIPIVTNPAFVSKMPVALKHRRFIDIKDIEKPGIIDQILGQYEEVVSTSSN